MSIRIEGLSVGYGAQPVIEGLQLHIERGSFFTLLGPSGCGKTTLLRTLAGFVPARAGRIWFGDQDVTSVPAHQRDIGMVFQDYALFPDKTVFDNVAYGLRARKQGAAQVTRKVGEALERVGLGALAQRHPAALSGGQRQRVALARALVIQPRLLLMDEPLSNLDAKLRLQVRQTIADLQAEAGITTVFVTHDQDEALALSQRIGVMHQGRLAQVGTPAQIYREPANAFVAGFVGAANLLPVVLPAAVAAGAQASVTLAGTALVARAPLALPAGPALLMVRPEDISFASADEGGLPAHITRRQYLGQKTSYRVQLADASSNGPSEGPSEGQALQVDGHGPGHDAHQAGQAVALRLNPATALLLPR